MAPITILVTGATGGVGSSVVDQLVRTRDVHIRAAVHRPENGAHLPRSGVTPVPFDFDDPRTYAGALSGVDRVFLLTTATPNQAEQTKRFVEAAKVAGIKHVVRLSVAGASPTAPIQLGRWHGDAEAVLQGSGIPWTFLRPNTFMQNFLTYFAPDKEGNVFLPWGQGACSFIDSRDVAAAAVVALTSNAHTGKAYDLTGPEALNVQQVAEIISRESKRSVRYVDVPEAAAQAGMTSMGMPAFIVQAMMEFHAVCKAGYTAGISPAFQEVTGVPPRMFVRFAAEHASRWAV
jgi:uncharacterized protein YbjT (DUF2867 family)